MLAEQRCFAFIFGSLGMAPNTSVHRFGASGYRECNTGFLHDGFEKERGREADLASGESSPGTVTPREHHRLRY